MDEEKKTCGYTQDEFGYYFSGIEISTVLPSGAILLPFENFSWIVYLVLVQLAFGLHFIYRSTRVYKSCTKLDKGFNHACNLSLIVTVSLAILAKVMTLTDSGQALFYVWALSCAWVILFVFGKKFQYFESIGFDDPWPWNNKKN